MTAEQLLSDLQQRDVAFTLNGERLRVEAPCGVLTEELRSTLSKHKPEIVRVLRDRSQEEAGGSAIDHVDAERIAAMRLSTFARASLVVRVRSEVLDCDVLFVSDNVSDSALGDTNLPVFRAAELRKLILFRPKPRDLQRIHEIKTIFNGAITDVRPRDEKPRDR